MLQGVERNQAEAEIKFYVKGLNSSKVIKNETISYKGKY